jgi:signal peptidase I
VPLKQKILPLLFFLIILFPVWAGGYVIAGTLVVEQLGYSTEDMNIVGTGSMYPTWPKGTPGKDDKELRKEVVSTAGFLPYPNGLAFGSRKFFGHQLDRGDIITWENDATRALTSQGGADPAGLMKRLIGLPGDTIELRDGIVYLNREPQKEPYIAKARSTFGEKFLKECQVVTVPEGEIFAMGDNRKGSADSREIGFAPIKDIDFVLPLSKQKGNLDKNWHDTTNDLDELAKIRLDKEKYVQLLNEKRKEAGVKQLKYQPKLEKSAGKRGEVILKYDDFSFEATRSSYTMARAMNESGYSNTVWGEAPSQGYYEAEELLENQFEFPESKKFLLEKDYQEIGIAEVQGLLNGCPTQIVVQHFAGYVPPNYKVSDIESWEKALLSLKEILPSWEKIRNSPHLYKDHPDISERIIQIIQLRISRIQAIVSRMRANQWLTSEERSFTDQDVGLYNEQQELAKQLNSYNW